MVSPSPLIRSLQPVEVWTSFPPFLLVLIFDTPEKVSLESTALFVFPCPLGYLKHLFISPSLGRKQMFLQTLINFDHSWSWWEKHLQFMHTPIFHEDMRKFQAGLGQGKMVFEITIPQLFSYKKCKITSHKSTTAACWIKVSNRSSNCILNLMLLNNRPYLSCNFRCANKCTARISTASAWVHVQAYQISEVNCSLHNSRLLPLAYFEKADESEGSQGFWAHLRLRTINKVPVLSYIWAEHYI